MKIYDIGSANIDYVYNVSHITKPGETLSSSDMQIFPGGKGLNQAVALSKAGADVIFGAILGSGGKFLFDLLKESGVDVGKIKLTEKSDGHAIIQVDENGENSILLFAGTNASFTEEYIDEILLDAKKGDILLLQNEINCLDYLFKVAKEKNMLIAFNPSPFSESIYSLPLCDVDYFFCNEIEGEALFESSVPEGICDNFIEKYPNSNLILTLGEDGSIFKNKDEYIVQPIFETKVVDTTAAGDTFTGYFLSEIAKGGSFETALKRASKASSIAVSRNGAAASVPHYSEVEI